MPKIIVQFSGGKDSQASLIWAVEKYGPDKVTAVFCDTEWEHPITYDHVQSVMAQLGVKLVTLRRKDGGMVPLAEKKKRFPSTKARFCTEELKVKPFIDWLIETVQDHVIIIEGVRNDESTNRASAKESCRYFRYYFEAYGKKADGSPRKFTYRANDVREWCAKYDDSLYRPFVRATAQEVIDYVRQRGHDVNGLYYMGFGRVGCMPCIMARHSEVRQMADLLPDAAARLIEAEKTVGHTFFPPDYIPKRYQTGRTKDGMSIPTAEDVMRYVASDKAQTAMFKEDDKPRRCMSVYNICE